MFWKIFSVTEKNDYLAERNFSKKNSASKMLEKKNFAEDLNGNSGQN